MTPGRVLLAIIFPPLAVLDKGCGTATLVFVLTMFGWFPGMILALYILASEDRFRIRNPHNLVSGLDGRIVSDGNRRFVQIPVQSDEPFEEKAKRKGAFIRLQDGETAEVIEDDGLMPGKHKCGL